jgi:hypothetical protein
VIPNGGGAPTFAAGGANFSSVTFSSPDLYCLTPAATVNPAAATPVVSADIAGQSTTAGVPYAVLDSKACAANQFGVRTFLLSATGPSASNTVPFTIVVP